MSTVTATGIELLDASIPDATLADLTSAQGVMYFIKKAVNPGDLNQLMRVSQQTLAAYMQTISTTTEGVTARPIVNAVFDSASTALPLGSPTLMTIDGVPVTVGFRVLVLNSSNLTQVKRIMRARFNSGNTAVTTWTIEQDGTGSDDPAPVQTVFVRSGTIHAGFRYWFESTQWSTDTPAGLTPPAIGVNFEDYATANDYPIDKYLKLQYAGVDYLARAKANYTSDTPENDYANDHLQIFGALIRDAIISGLSTYSSDKIESQLALKANLSGATFAGQVILNHLLSLGATATTNASAGAVHNLDTVNRQVIRMTAATNISGISRVGTGYSVHYIYNATNAIISISAEDTNSLTANRFLTPEKIAPKSFAKIIYSVQDSRYIAMPLFSDFKLLTGLANGVCQVDINGNPFVAGVPFQPQILKQWNNSAALTDSTTETSLMDANFGAKSLVGAYLLQGREIVWFERFEFTNVATTPTLTYRLYTAATERLNIPILMTAGKTYSASLEAKLIIKTTGAGGTANLEGWLIVIDLSDSSEVMRQFIDLDFAINTTANVAINSTVEWDSADLNHTAVGKKANIRFNN